MVIANTKIANEELIISQLSCRGELFIWWNLRGLISPVLLVESRTSQYFVTKTKKGNKCDGYSCSIKESIQCSAIPQVWGPWNRQGIPSRPLRTIERTKFGACIVVYIEGDMLYLPKRFMKIIKADDIEKLNKIKHVMIYKGKDAAKSNRILLDFEIVKEDGAGVVGEK